MENNTINFKQFKMQAKIETCKKQVVEAGKKAWNWYWTNRQYTVPVTVVAVGFMNKGVTKLVHELAVRREEQHRDLKSWDPRLGEYLELRRALTNSEKVILDSRMANGERKVDILKDLNVLK